MYFLSFSILKLCFRILRVFRQVISILDSVCIMAQFKHFSFEIAGHDVVLKLDSSSNFVRRWVWTHSTTRTCQVHIFAISSWASHNDLINHIHCFSTIALHAGALVSSLSASGQAWDGARPTLLAGRPARRRGRLFTEKVKLLFHVKNAEIFCVLIFNCEFFY